MKIMIESTDVITTIDGVPVRLWRGQTESGIAVRAFIHRIQPADMSDHEEFERELKAQADPRELRTISLRHII